VPRVEDGQPGAGVRTAPGLQGVLPTVQPERYQALHAVAPNSTCHTTQTLDYIHSQGIMHRDIKPHNVLINHHKRSLKIVDFGLAEYYFPDKEYSSKVASLYYKAPEILLGSVKYDYRIDIWAVGMMLAGMVHQALSRSSERPHLSRASIPWIKFTSSPNSWAPRRCSSSPSTTRSP
jgi:serine/threonine protein kinase